MRERKILLINPMASRKNIRKGRASHFPVGLALISAYLKENGIKVDIFDNETECLNKYDLRSIFEKSEYDYYGITGMSPQYSYIKGLSRLIKETKNRPIVLGGPLATYSWDVVLKNTDIDVCVIGEGEETIVDLLRNMAHLDLVPGIAYKSNEKVFRTGPRTFAKSRDEYPFPDYGAFDLEPYFQKSLIQYEMKLARRIFNRPRSTTVTRTIGMVTGIGCPYNCRFCSRSVQKARLRSVDCIISEIHYLKKNYDIEGVFFLDDLLLINKKRALEFCEKLKPLDLIWSGQGRSNIFDNEIARAVKDSGCIGVGLGIESGSDRMLNLMRKGVTAEENVRAMRAVVDNGLILRPQLLFGFPGENRDSINETIGIFRRANVPPRRFNIFTPLPGSSVYEDCLAKGLIDDEEKYLEEVSRSEAGFGSKKVLLNMTGMNNQEFEELLNYAEVTMEKNYEEFLKSKYRFWGIKSLSRLILRFLFKGRRVFSVAAWKRKLDEVIWRIKKKNLTRSQIEDMYFNL